MSKKAEKDKFIKLLAIKLANNKDITDDLIDFNKKFSFIGTKYTIQDIKQTHSYINALKAKI